MLRREIDTVCEVNGTEKVLPTHHTRKVPFSFEHQDREQKEFTAVAMVTEMLLICGQ